MIKECEKDIVGVLIVDFYKVFFFIEGGGFFRRSYSCCGIVGFFGVIVWG